MSAQPNGAQPNGAQPNGSRDEAEERQKVRQSVEAVLASAQRPLNRVYTQFKQGENWLERQRGRRPLFACVLGFTETGLIPGISAAGATPADRQYTVIADAEFLYHGSQACPTYPLPPLDVGASPVLISRAIVSAQQIPLYLFNAGLLMQPTVPAIDLHGVPARCLSQGRAMALSIVEHLLEQGLLWGATLAGEADFIILGECVVGGTTTALAVLTGLGIAAAGKVNSSHATCNHRQKWALVQQGLERSGLWTSSANASLQSGQPPPSPLSIVAAVGDPMQIVVAGMAIAASRTAGVLLAGGTQMLAVYALIKAIAQSHHLAWQPEQIVVGTTRWVADDTTGDTVGLANLVGDVPLIATQLSFASSRHKQLQAYEQGFVKEGVGAGGCAIAAHLYQNWSQADLLTAIDTLAGHQHSISHPSPSHRD